MSVSTKINTITYRLPDGCEFNMVRIPGGRFMMGDKDERVFSVELPDFELGQYPITQELWESVMETNPSFFKGLDRPVESIHWYDAVEFCNELDQKMSLITAYKIDKSRIDDNNENEYDGLKWKVSQNLKANTFRLPTEAEWEYAARGGKYSRDTEYVGSVSLKETGWYGIGDGGNSMSQSQIIGNKAPNELGLYDMSGNIWEWCWDWYGSYPDISESQTPIYAPMGAKRGHFRVLRGGSLNNYAGYCRVSYRLYGNPDSRNGLRGFRLARTLNF